MTILNIVKSALRISTSNTSLDDNICECIEESISDLVASGLTPEAFLPNWGDDILWQTETETIKDKNICKVIKLYCLAYFGLENPDKDFYVEQHEKAKLNLLNRLTQYKGYKLGGNSDV